MPVELRCTVCGRPFRVPPSRVARGTHTCGPVCGGIARRRSLTGERFWTKVEKSADPDGCWEWQGAKHDHGYGRLWLRQEDGSRRTAYAHRTSWEMANGAIPEGLDVLHRCDNPACVRPDHLFLGDQRENNVDRDTKGRVHRGENTGGARLTEQDVRRIREIVATGLLSQRSIARVYRVSHATIDDIVNQKTWTHVS